MVRAVLSAFPTRLEFHQIVAGFAHGAEKLLAKDAIEDARNYWIAMEIAMLLVGLLFWITLSVGISAFSPETWGAWACYFPARLWAGVQIVASALVIWGLMVPITWRLAVAGAVLHAVQLQFLAISAMASGGEVVIGIYPSVLFVPAHLLIIWQAVRYGNRR